MPQVFATRLQQRIAAAREAFNHSQTTDGKPYPLAQRKKDEAGLDLTPSDKQAYLGVAEWGVKVGAIEVGEFAVIQSAMSGTLADSGWHLSCDLAAKVLVTKVVNELLELRGDA